VPTRGLMMDMPLTLPHVLERAARLFPNKEIVSRIENRLHRYTYRDFHGRVHRMAHALRRLGIGRGDRVGTLCWNSFAHLELYFAVPCMGAVLHTLNLRLSEDQLAWIIHHAEDRIIVVDESLLPLIESIRARIPLVERVVVIDKEDYEKELDASGSAPYPWPDLEETEACATCYTSGTTGNPKGVLYTHRSLFLHSLSLSMADVFGICESDVVLQIVPMFHANGWGIPFAAIMNGSGIVLCGRRLQPEDVLFLIESQRATFMAAVPTIWMSLYNYLENHPGDLSSLRLATAAGTALPRQYVESYEKKYGVPFRLAWGMTETCPIATVTTLKRHMEGLPDPQRYDAMARHGLPSAGVEIRVVDEQTQPVPWDGRTMGELQIRGPWVTSGYVKEARPPEQIARESFQEGWFRTGDVATVDPEGYIQITDRTKDLVKSGGEWISTVDLENAIMAHPKVAEAAVVAIPHEKWQERPLAAVVALPDYQGVLDKQEILDFLASRVAKWWLPDEIVFLEALPKTSVGKFNKRALREQFANYLAPGATRTTRE
jgi:fatty-acyl-CoA synthase